MKKLLSLLLVIVLCFLLTACVDVYSSVDDYQIIYDNVEKANKTFTKSGKKETLLEFDEEHEGIRARIADAPVLEGSVSAAVAASSGDTLENVIAAAEEARGMKKLQ